MTESLRIKFMNGSEPGCLAPGGYILIWLREEKNDKYCTA